MQSATAASPPHNLLQSAAPEAYADKKQLVKNAGVFVS